MKTLEQLKAAGDAPEWLENSAYQTLCGGYLFGEETPKEMYRRVASTVSRSLKKPELEARFFDILWKNWLCPSTPVLCNAGTDRGLPISCFSSYMADDTYEILETLQEVAMLSKYGGGTAIHINDIRPKGAPISKGGHSDGVVPFMKMADSVILGISQGSTRRGACAAYIDIEHGDFDEFLHSRRPTGDTNRQCLNLHHGVCVSNAFIDKVKAGDTEARRRWRELIKSRVETGEPYVFFSDNANDQAPEVLKNTGIRLKGSNLCSEIFLPTDKDHTFVCCLSSLNLARWDEWKDTDTVQLSVWFLDGIMEEFIQKSANLRGFEKALRFAKKSRALGLGVLGLHSYFQKNMIAFDSLQAYLQNKIIFKKIREEAEIATGYLAKEYGEPEWCKGHGRRNATLMAIAPTVSNSLIASNVSQGIEPWIANAFAQKSAKGTFVRRNPELEKLLKSMGQDTDEVWGSILKNDGSVQHLECLTAEQKEVYLTARELNQFAIIKLAAERQKFIDQGQSINVFFPANSDPKYINQVHLEAANSGLKSLYYLRSTSILKAEQNSNAVYKRELTECTWCEG
jgi:ribonucleoside-diphosphate reductase alpha chain